MSSPDLKYPRTYHLPSSPGLQNDDRRLPSTEPFIGRRVLLLEKMDGEGTTMKREKTYPRSPDGRYHPSRDVMKAFHAERAHHIPEGWRISGEYMYARHSVPYTRENGNPLAAWFLGFAVWDERNVSLPWDEAVDVMRMIDVVPVPVLYDGPYDEAVIARIAASIDPQRQEGFVIRVADAIPYPDGPGDAGRFFKEVAKWVRKGHVQTDQHWMAGPVIPNELADEGQ